MATEQQPITIITDATSDLLRKTQKVTISGNQINVMQNVNLLETFPNIKIVPVSVNIGDKSYLDQGNITINTQDDNLPMAKFLELTRQSPALPTTAALGPGVYGEVYGMHPGRIISISFGGTVDTLPDGVKPLTSLYANASLGAQEHDVGINRISVFDAKKTSLGMGFLVLRAAQMAKEGKNTEQILEELTDMEKRTRLIVALETLDNLKKGGRIGSIQHWLGSVLGLKPMLEVAGNQIQPLNDRIRTTKKAHEKLINIVREMNEKGIEQIAVIHVNAEDEAINMAMTIKEFFTGDVLVVETGPALTTHAGEGAIGIAVVQAKN